MGLSRAKSFMEVLRGAAWAEKASANGFKLGKFLDDLSLCLEHEAKKALGPAGVNKLAKSRKGDQAGSRDTAEDASAGKMPSSYRRGVLPQGRSGTASGDATSSATLASSAALEGGISSFSSSYPWNSAPLPETRPRMPMTNGSPTSSLGTAAIPGTGGSLLGTEAPLSTSAAGIMVMPPSSVTGSSGIYSAPGRGQDSRAPQGVLE